MLNKPLYEVIVTDEEILHVFPSMEDALLYEQDYAAAGWRLTGYDSDPAKSNPYLDNAWSFTKPTVKKPHAIVPRVMGSGWAH